MEPSLASEQRAGEPLTAPGIPTGSGARRLVVVPRAVGPIVPLDRSAEGARDELDLLVDDVFGPSTDERPGFFDLLLVVGGATLLAWMLVTGASGLVAIAALVAIALGLALPVRSLVRRYRARAAARRLRSAERRGYLLDVTTGPTAALLGAYEELVATGTSPGSVYSGRAVDAGHLALVEVATLLRGDLPSAPAQDAYVAKRTDAITRLTRQLADAHRRWLDDQAAEAAEEAERRQRWVTAVTEARDQLQAEDRFGSLAQLERLASRLTREARDGEG